MRAAAASQSGPSVMMQSPTLQCFYFANSVADVFGNVSRPLAKIFDKGIGSLLKVFSMSSGGERLLSPGFHSLQCCNNSILKFDAFFANSVDRQQ
jgi:hypothetical protein